MPREFDQLEAMLDFLRTKGVSQVALSSRVATTTSPGGDQISFRGWVTAEACYSQRGRAHYTEYIMPYISQTKSPDLPASPVHAATLRAAQLSLARQLRTYRGEYRALVDQTKASIAARIAQAGFTLAEPEE